MIDVFGGMLVCSFLWICLLISMLVLIDRLIDSVRLVKLGSVIVVLNSDIIVIMISRLNSMVIEVIMLNMW